MSEVRTSRCCSSTLPGQGWFREKSTHPDHRRFLADLLTNRFNRAILDAWNTLELEDGWLVAGCLFQTVWNLQAGRAPEEGIKDYDIFYFNAGDLSAAGEKRVQERVDRTLGFLGVAIEVKNQARVHLWYEEQFGYPYPRLASAQEGIDRFLIPATCLGVRRVGKELELYAPHGLATLYSGVLTPNPLTFHLPLFRSKAASYRSRWEWLEVREEP
jgi:hypothetical protein